MAVAPPRDAPAPSQPPTASIDEDLSTARVKPVQTRDRPAPQLDDEVLEHVNESIQRTAASLERVERRIRIRQRIRKKFGSPQSLTPEERAEITAQLADQTYFRTGASWTRGRGSADRRIRTENTESSLAQEKRRSRTAESNPRTVSVSDRPEQSQSRPAVDDSKAQNEFRPSRSPNNSEQRRKPKPDDDSEESGNN